MSFMDKVSEFVSISVLFIILITLLCIGTSVSWFMLSWAFGIR